jgi:hypothetical protein
MGLHWHVYINVGDFLTLLCSKGLRNDLSTQKRVYAIVSSGYNIWQIYLGKSYITINILLFPPVP